MASLRRVRPYGHTLFSKPRLRTTDEAVASASRFIYGSDGETWPSDPAQEGWWSTSLLGIVNGYLKYTGFRFVYAITEEQPSGGRYILRMELNWFGWR